MSVSNIFTALHRVQDILSELSLITELLLILVIQKIYRVNVNIWVLLNTFFASSFFSYDSLTRVHFEINSFDTQKQSSIQCLGNIHLKRKSITLHASLVSLPVLCPSFHWTLPQTVMKRKAPNYFPFARWMSSYTFDRDHIELTFILSAWKEYLLPRNQRLLCFICMKKGFKTNQEPITQQPSINSPRA
jgi:hypothetical protein